MHKESRPSYQVDIGGVDTARHFVIIIGTAQRWLSESLKEQGRRRREEEGRGSLAGLSPPSANMHFSASPFW